MFPSNVAEMLDLPKAERSRYLAAIPLTRTFVFGCLETAACRWIRKTLVRHGATFRECYAMPGVYWVATFRDAKGMRAACLAISRWLYRAELSLAKTAAWADLDAMWFDFDQPSTDVPALIFVRDVRIRGPRRTERLIRPLD